MRGLTKIALGVVSILVIGGTAVASVAITEDDFSASGGGTVSLESYVVRFDGNLGIRLDHDFSQGGKARVVPYRVSDTTDASWTGGSLDEWSYWSSHDPSYLPAITFYFDDGVSDYYSGSNVTHIVNLTSVGSQASEGTYNGAEWWNVTSNGSYTYYVNSLSGWGPTSGKTWADIVSEDGIKAGFGASPATYHLHDAALVGILIGYPGQLGSNQTVTAYLDGITIDGTEYEVQSGATPSAIPEPASVAIWSLMVLGFVAFGCSGRGRRRANAA